MFILYCPSIIRAKLLEDECNFFCVCWLVWEGYFCEFTCGAYGVGERVAQGSGGDI